MIAGHAQATGCATDASYGTGCGEGYPTPLEYGTHSEITRMPNGEIRVQRNLSSDEQNETHVYDYQDRDDEFDDYE